MDKIGGIPLTEVRGLGALRFLTLATVVATFGLVTLGGAVRVTDSGLACPDWPLCYGRVIPPFELSAILEYSHRLAASVVSVLVLATAAWVWLFHRKQSWLLVPVVLSVLLLGGQVVLGGVTVLRELPSMVVLAHLAMAEALMAVMVVVCIVAWRSGNGMLSLQGGWQSRVVQAPGLVLGCVGAVYLLLLTGSYVTVSGASWACGNAWPLCEGGLISGGTLATAHMAHRLVVLVVGGLLLWLLGWAWRQRHLSREVWLVALAVVILYVGQAMVGAANVWLGFTQGVRLLHLLMATLTWTTIVVLVTLVYLRGRFLSTVEEG